MLRKTLLARNREVLKYNKKKMTEKKLNKATGQVNQLLNIVSNEPSLGLYRIQEHVRKSVPKLQKQVFFCLKFYILSSKQ